MLLIGLPGSGKTTLARRLERERRALRLTPDEWITTLLGPQPAATMLDAMRAPVEALQWDVAARALTLGIDVVLDFGLWTRAEREDFRARAASLGAASELHYLEIAREELFARVARRNAEPPGHAFTIDAEQLAAWWDVFEPPGADELVRRGPPGR